MSYNIAKLKNGMSGSNGGRNRWYKTALLKEYGKAFRRRENKRIVKEQLEEGNR